MDISPAILRILDANANRALEALRVIEESARFGRADSFLAGRTKEARHNLGQTVKVLRERHLVVRCRDTEHDVGTKLATPSERSRESLEQIVAANFGRLKEALRCLEEYCKPIDSEVSVRFEKSRYDAYTLEKAIVTTSAALARLADARLYGLTNAHGEDAEFAARITRLAEATDMLQLRDKDLADDQLLDRARLFVELCRGKCVSVVNDRSDIAAAAQADGVHLGQDDLPAVKVRQLFGPRLLIGVSTHSLDEARAAVIDGADYIGVGPTFHSETKTFEQLAGLDLVAEVAREIELPAFAIGGISPNTIDQVVAAGARRVAVSACLATTSDPQPVAAELRERLRQVRAESTLS